MKTLNNFFFDEDSITLSDALWFYGIIGLIVVVGSVYWTMNIIDLIKVIF